MRIRCSARSWRRVAHAPLLLIVSARLSVQTFPRRRSIDRRVLGVQEPLMAHLAHLGEIMRFRSFFASLGQVSAIAIACASLWSSPLHRDAVLVAHGDVVRITAWRLAVQGAQLDSNPPPTHSPPLDVLTPPFLPPCRRLWPRIVCMRFACAFCACFCSRGWTLRGLCWELGGG